MCTTNVADDDRKTDVDDQMIDDDVVVDDDNDDEGDEECRKKRVKGRKREGKDIYNILLTQLRPPIYKTLMPLDCTPFQMQSCHLHTILKGNFPHFKEVFSF